jgi:thiol-disulfide isomerase/thioredoxin
MDAVTLVAALTMSGVFGLAGITKLRDLEGTRTAVRAFGAPVAIVPVIALVLPLVELAVAVSLLAPTTRVVGAAGALGLLALFSVVIAVNLARGKKPECHCFGQLHSAPTGWKTLVRNGLLGSIAAGLLAATRNDAGSSPWGWVAARNATELGLIVGVIGVATLILAIGASFLALTRAYGRVLLRLEATEKALRGAGIEIATDAAAGMSELGLDPGSPAPQFAMQLSNAEPVTRDDLLAPGLPTLLVFTSPGCGPCHDLLPAVARWQHELNDRLTVAVASAGEPEAIRGQEAEHGLAAMLVDPDLALSEAYLTTGTPSAVLIAPDGTIASYVAAGSEEIEALVERSLSGPADDSDEGLPVGTPAPELDLVGVDGAIVPITDPDARETLFLFWNPGCGYCQDMLPGLLAWEQEPHDGAPRLVVVSSGDADDTAADGLRSLIVLDSEFAVGTAFEAGGTPMAVVVDGRGKVASPLLAGGDAVLTRLGGSRVGLERR